MNNRSVPGANVRSSGLLNVSCGKTRSTVNGAGGLGEPVTRLEVQGRRGAAEAPGSKLKIQKKPQSANIKFQRPTEQGEVAKRGEEERGHPCPRSGFWSIWVVGSPLPEGDLRIARRFTAGFRLAIRRVPKGRLSPANIMRLLGASSPRLLPALQSRHGQRELKRLLPLRRVGKPERLVDAFLRTRLSARRRERAQAEQQAA